MSEIIHAADLSTLYHFNAGPFTVHNEWGKIINDERWKASNNSFPLLRLLFSDPNLELLTTASRDTDSNGNYRWLLEGKTQFGSDVEKPANDEYFSTLGDLLEPHELVIGDSLFGNLKIVKPAEGRIVGAVNLGKDNVTTVNKGTSTYAGNRPGVSMTMIPPTVAELKSKTANYDSYGYFRDTLKTHILATVALAECVTGKKVETRQGILITSKDTTYLYDETEAKGVPARERISLTGSGIRLGEVVDDEQSRPQSASTETVFDISSLEVVEKERKVRIDDIAGPDTVREQLMEVVLAQRNPKALEKWGVKRPQGVLLYGPAGTGKSMAAEALANELGGKLWEIRASDITDKWLGNTEKNMQGLFDQAKKTTVPTVMFWDEIDSLVGKTDGETAGGRALEAARGVFKREVARLGESAPNVILVGATNHPGDIDEALIRVGRFDMKIYMGLPDEAARLQLFANRIADVMHRYETEDNKLYAEDLDIRRLVELTDEWSGAEIVELLRRAQMKKAIAEIRGQETGPISQDDLEQVLQLFRRER